VADERRRIRRGIPATEPVPRHLLPTTAPPIFAEADATHVGARWRLYALNMDPIEPEEDAIRGLVSAAYGALSAEPHRKRDTNPCSG
jgi:hypothetical protein